MSSLRNRFSFGRPKDGTTARFTENKPTRSSSLPTLSFPKRIFSLARSNSLGKYKPEPHPRRGIDDADRVCSREGDSLNRTGDRDKSSSQHVHSTDAHADQYPTASSRNQTRIASPAEIQRDDLLGADEGTPEPTGSLEDLDERGNIKPVEFSPIDEAVISMLQELDDNMLDSTPRLGTTEESLLETIYEEPDCDESLRPSTPESRLSSSAASSATVAEIPPSVSPPGETQQEDNIDGAEETLPIHSSPLTFHEMQAAVNEWEEKKSRHRKSYSATLPPAPTENLEVQLQPFDYDDLD